MKIFSSLRKEDILKIEELREDFLKLVSDKDYSKVVKFIKVVKKIDSLSFKVMNSLEDQDKIEKYKKDLESQKAEQNKYIQKFGEGVNRLVFKFVIMTNIMNIKNLIKEVNFME